MKSILLLLLLVPAAVLGQARRTIQPLQLWPEAQAELALKNGDYLLLALRGQRETDADYGSNQRLGFGQGRVMLGYEHFWNERWSYGATLGFQTISGRATPNELIPEVLLRHRSAVGPLTFGQRLSVERTLPLVADKGGAGPDNQTNVRLRFDLEKPLPLGKLVLRPRLSYTALSHIRLQKEENETRKRTVQFTSLRAEVGCRVSNKLDFTPWVAYQTNYFYTLESRNGMNQVVVPAGPLNLVTPVLGLDIRLTIGRDETRVAQPAQLPTQH